MPEKNVVLLNRTRGELIKLAITVLLPMLIFLIPTNEVFTPNLRLFFVITMVAILSFATEALHQTGVALALPLVYVVTKVAPPPGSLCTLDQLHPLDGYRRLVTGIDS